jgi:hypothetical protein
MLSRHVTFSNIATTHTQETPKGILLQHVSLSLYAPPAFLVRPQKSPVDAPSKKGLPDGVQQQSQISTFLP